MESSGKGGLSWTQIESVLESAHPRGLQLLLPKFKLANRPCALFKVPLKPCDYQSEPDGEEISHSWLFPKGSLKLLSNTRFVCFYFFAPGEGVAECEALSELLIIIFHLHSLWLSLSRSLLSGTFFFLFFFLSSRHCHIGTWVSGSSRNGAPQLGRGRGDGNHVGWGKSVSPALLTPVFLTFSYNLINFFFLINF